MTSSKKTSDGEFQVIWDQLTFQVETRPWYKNPKFDIFNKSKLDEINSTKKNVLNNISGSIKSGQLTGILGPSGAGKTSLLHCLFQNMTNGVTGNIVCKSDHDNEMKICYIPQKDYLIEHLTVREDLIFVSKLRAVTNAKGTNLVGERVSSESNKQRANDNVDITQPFVDCISTTTDEHNDEHIMRKNNNEVVDHDKIVENIADLLGLTSCLDVKISKISGGQSKRVSIAREIMAKPDILILDEPTTGLDSLTCYKTIQLLKSIADNTLIGSSDTKKMAIVVVIHQPQIEVFNIFDKTYFISKQGNVIYDDNPNKVSRILDLAANTKLPSANYNTASYLIEVASGEYGQDIIDKLSLYYKNKFEREFDVEKIIDEMEYKPQQRNMTLSKISKLDYINSNDTINSQQQIPARKRRKSSSISIDLTKINPDIVVAVNRNIRLKELEMRENNSNQSIDNYTLRRESAASNDIVSPVEPAIKKKHYYISPQLEDCLSGHSISMSQSFSHLFILTQRAWLSTLRNPSLTKSRIIFHIISPLLVSLIYGTYIGHANACPNVSEEIDIQDIKNDINDGVIAQLQNDARSTYENMGFFFILMFSFTVNVLTVTSSIYPLSMQMFRKEVINGLYKSTPYLIAQTLAEIPLEIFLPTLSICIAYWFTDQPGSFLAWRMLTVSLVMVITCYTFHSIGLLFGSLFINNVNAAMLMAQAVSLPLSILCGFLARPSKMDEYTRMISYISPYKHGLEAALVARYGFGMCPCDKETNFTRLGTINGITPQVEHVLDYLFPKNASDENGEVHPNEIFSKLGKRFAQSQTYGFEMNSCQDVKPFIMHTHQLNDETLYYRLAALLAIIVVLKAITFYLVNSVPQRMQAL